MRTGIESFSGWPDTQRRKCASSRRIDAEEARDLLLAHPIEIVGYHDLADHETRRFTFGASSGTTLTIGFPDFAMPNDSPVAASAVNRDNQVFA